jgi:hypothetical protein
MRECAQWCDELYMLGQCGVNAWLLTAAQETVSRSHHGHT